MFKTIKKRVIAFSKLPGEQKSTLLKMLPLWIKYRSSQFLYLLATVEEAEHFLNRYGFNHSLSKEPFQVYNDYVHLREIVDEEMQKGELHGAHFAPAYFLLYALIKARRPATVVETGVAAGFSSYFILKALHDNQKGHLISIDLPNYYSNKGYINQEGQLELVYTSRDRGIGWVVPNYLRSRWTMLNGDSLEMLSKIEERPEIFFHDSDHSERVMTTEYEWALAAGADFILSDDINRNHAWARFVGNHNLPHIEISGQGLSIVR